MTWQCHVLYLPRFDWIFNPVSLIAGCFALGWFLLLLTALAMTRHVMNDVRRCSPFHGAAVAVVKLNRVRQLHSRRRIEHCPSKLTEGHHRFGSQSTSPSTTSTWLPIALNIFLGRSLWGFAMMPLCICLMGGHVLVWMSGRMVWALAMASSWAMCATHVADVGWQDGGDATRAVPSYQHVTVVEAETSRSLQSFWSLQGMGEHAQCGRQWMTSFFILLLLPYINGLMPFWFIWLFEGNSLFLLRLATMTATLLGFFLWGHAGMSKRSERIK